MVCGVDTAETSQAIPGTPLSPLEYAQTLSRGLSQTTTNLIASCLEVNPRLITHGNVGTAAPRTMTYHDSQWQRASAYCEH